MGGQRRGVGVDGVASSVLDALADGGEVVRAAVALVVLMSACVPSQPPSPPPVVDSGDADPCVAIQHVDQTRHIRLADGGTYNEPCSDE